MAFLKVEMLYSTGSVEKIHGFLVSPSMSDIRSHSLKASSGFGGCFPGKFAAEFDGVAD